MLNSALDNYPDVLTPSQKDILALRVTGGVPEVAVDTMQHVLRLACCIEFALRGEVSVIESGGDLTFAVNPSTKEGLRALLHAAAQDKAADDGK